MIERIRSITVSECFVPGEFGTDDKLMNRLRAFVCDDGFKIEHVPNGATLDADSTGTEHVACVACHVHPDAYVVPLGERDLGVVHRPGIFHAAELYVEQLSRRHGDVERRRHELHLALADAERADNIGHRDIHDGAGDDHRERRQHARHRDIGAVSGAVNAV